MSHPETPMAELVVGAVYTVTARNFSVGIWGPLGFTGCREKFDTWYLDTEAHWDVGGTARGFQRLGAAVAMTTGRGAETRPDGWPDGKHPDEKEARREGLVDMLATDEQTLLVMLCAMNELLQGERALEAAISIAGLTTVSPHPDHPDFLHLAPREGGPIVEAWEGVRSALDAHNDQLISESAVRRANEQLDREAVAREAGEPVPYPWVTEPEGEG